VTAVVVSVPLVAIGGLGSSNSYGNVSIRMASCCEINARSRYSSAYCRAATIRASIYVSSSCDVDAQMLLGFCERHRLDCRRSLHRQASVSHSVYPSFACSLYSGGTRLVLDCRSLKHCRLNVTG
jgi:hypothetical protein